MASNNNSRYGKRRIKPKKIDPNQNPFEKELKDTRNKKIIGIVAGIIVIIMVATMFLPYLSNQDNLNYKLPNEILTAKEDTSKQQFSINKISLGQSFNRLEDDYYVLFGKEEDLYDIQNSLSGKNVYLVNPDLSVNSSLLNDVNKAKALPQNPNEIKIKDKIAIIRIENHKATKFLNTKANVEKYVKTIK